VTGGPEVAQTPRLYRDARRAINCRRPSGRVPLRGGMSGDDLPEARSWLCRIGLGRRALMVLGKIAKTKALNTPASLFVANKLIEGVAMPRRRDQGLFGQLGAFGCLAQFWLFPGAALDGAAMEAAATRAQSRAVLADMRIDPSKIIFPMEVLLALIFSGEKVPEQGKRVRVMMSPQHGRDSAAVCPVNRVTALEPLGSNARRQGKVPPDNRRQIRRRGRVSRYDHHSSRGKLSDSRSPIVGVVSRAKPIASFCRLVSQSRNPPIRSSSWSRTERLARFTMIAVQRSSTFGCPTWMVSCCSIAYSSHIRRS